MRKRSLWIVTASLCLALSACGKKEPTGQVAARVEGAEITTSEVNAELNGFKAPNPQIRKQAEQAALQQVIARKVLAKAATKAGIEKTPEFAQMQQRVHDELLVQSWQQAIAKTVPEPSREEVQKFMTDHPDVYGGHKIFVVDQVRTTTPASPAVLKGLGPLNTLQDVENYLTQHQIGFQTGNGRLDVLAIDPDIAERVAKLPPNELFVVPAGNMVVINQIVSSQVVPLPPEVAFRDASAALKAKRTREAIGRKFESVLAAAKKDIKYNKDYQPPAPQPAKAAAPATPAKPKP